MCTQERQFSTEFTRFLYFTTDLQTDGFSKPNRNKPAVFLKTEPNLGVKTHIKDMQ